VRSLLLTHPFSQVISMHEFLPYRFQPRDPEKVYFCHLCHGKLLPGETFTLLAMVKKVLNIATA
jgi:hypothetical protein